MKTLKQRIDELETELAELKKLAAEEKKPKRVYGWRSKKGEWYYHIANYDDIYAVIWDDNKVDFWRLSQKNVFRAREDAEAYVEISLRAQELIGDWVADFEDNRQPKWYIDYDYDNKEFKAWWAAYVIQAQGVTYMPKKAAETLLKEFDDDTLKLFVGQR